MVIGGFSPRRLLPISWRIYFREAVWRGNSPVYIIDVNITVIVLHVSFLGCRNSHFHFDWYCYSCRRTWMGRKNGARWRRQRRTVPHAVPSRTLPRARMKIMIHNSGWGMMQTIKLEYECWSVAIPSNMKLRSYRREVCWCQVVRGKANYVAFWSRLMELGLIRREFH